MEIFQAPRQCGKTTLLLKKAMKHGAATIVVPTHVLVQQVKAEIKKRPCITDLKVITFKEFCGSVSRGIKLPNVYIDDLEDCLCAFTSASNSNIVAATISMANTRMVCEELDKEQ